MKRFVSLFAVILIFMVVFLFFGGYNLFDFSKHPWLVVLACSLVIAAVVHAFMIMDDKIESLQERIRELEEHIR